MTVSGCCCLLSDSSSDMPDSGSGGVYGDTPLPDDVDEQYGSDALIVTEPAQAGQTTSSPAPTSTPTYRQTPTPTSSRTVTPTHVAYNDHVVQAADKAASNTSVKETSEAMLANDKAAFLEHMSKDTLQQVTGEPDLTNSQAVKLANSLKSAKLIQAEPYMMTYAITIDSKAYTFNTIKEDGTWKLTGL